MVFVRFDPNTGRYPSFRIYFTVVHPTSWFFRDFSCDPFWCWCWRWGSGLTDISFMGFHMASCFIVGCFPPWKIGAYGDPPLFMPTAPPRKVPRFNCRVVRCRSWSLCNLEFLWDPGQKCTDLVILLMLQKSGVHQLIGRLSLYLQGFIHPRWGRILSINSSLPLAHLFRWESSLKGFHVDKRLNSDMNRYDKRNLDEFDCHS